MKATEQGNKYAQKELEALRDETEREILKKALRRANKKSQRRKIA